MNIVRLYNSFVPYLSYEENAKKLALLQMSGRIEDYITKKFGFHIIKESSGVYSPLFNLGRKERIDLVIIDEKENVIAAIELKHLLSKNEYWNRGSTGRDNVGQSLKKLHEQLKNNEELLSKGEFEVTKDKSFNVVKNFLLSGIILASFYEERKKFRRKEKESFFDLVLRKAEENGFKNYKGKPIGPNDLKVIVNELEVNFLGRKWIATLKMGFFRI